MQKLKGKFINLMHLFVAGEIFSLKFTKYRLAAGLCLDRLGELKCRPPSRNKGAYF